jgi:GR25 family glycosyltransferase involved in LPS biosynthesis
MIATIKIIPLLFSSVLAYANMNVESNIKPIVKYLPKIELNEKDSGLNNIDCIYVINLDRRIDRWERTKKLFNDLDIYPNRFAAVNGWSLSEESKNELFGSQIHTMKSGATGCLLSHVSIYKDAFERGFNAVWICEDDIVFSGDVTTIPDLVNELDRVDPNWDVLYTDHSNHGTGVQLLRPSQKEYRPILGKILRKSDSFLRIHGRHQTYSMIFSKKGIKKALDYFTHTNLFSPIDVDIHYIPKFREYCTKHSIVTTIPEPLYSDTEFSNLGENVLLNE